MSERILSDVSKLEKSNDSELHINDLIDEIDKNIKINLIDQFGIAQLLDNFKDGGGVDTINNVRNDVYSNVNVEKNIKTATSGYNSFKANELHGAGSEKYRKINKLQTSLQKKNKLKDVNTGKLLRPNQKTDLDHTISTKEIYEDAGRVLAGKSSDEMANNSFNLHLTDRGINRSMGAQNKTDYAKKLKYKKEQWKKQNIIDQSDHNLSADKKFAKYENYKNKMSADEDTIKQNDANARHDYNKIINSKFYTSKKFINATICNSFKQGANQALQSFISITIYYCQNSIFSSVRLLINHWNDYRSIKEKFKYFIDTLKNKFIDIKEHLSLIKSSIISGFTGGFASSVFNTIVNAFKTTGKNFAKILCNSFSGLLSGFRAIFHNESNSSLTERIKKATKIVTKAILASTSLIFATYIGDTIVSLCPSLSFMHDILGNSISAILIGTLTGLLMFAISNFRKIFSNIKNKFNELMKGILVNPQTIKQNYLKSIAQIDDVYKKVLSNIFDEYSKTNKLQDLAYDMDLPTANQFSYSVSLAKNVGVKNDKILKNMNDINDFFTK